MQRVIACILPSELHYSLPPIGNLQDLTAELEARAGRVPYLKLTSQDITNERVENKPWSFANGKSTVNAISNPPAAPQAASSATSDNSTVPPNPPPPPRPILLWPLRRHCKQTKVPKITLLLHLKLTRPAQGERIEVDRSKTPRITSITEEEMEQNMATAIPAGKKGTDARIADLLTSLASIVGSKDIC